MTMQSSVPSGVRVLSRQELDLVTGGYGDTIVVIGDPWDPWWDYWNNDYNPWDPYGIGNDGGGGGGSSPEDAYPDAADTPCVETSFAGGSGVSTDRANNAALAASNAIKGLSPNQEWGSFIYELNGEVFYTTPFTNGSGNQVTFNTGVLPDGAHVLGIIHSHPDEAGIDDRTPSDHDWDTTYDSLAGQSTGRISIDSNMLMYIYTDEDGKTRVYDNTDDSSVQRERATCALEG